MSMMTPDSVFTFGKYKGKKASAVFVENPSYFYWLRETGFGDFGKEITEAIFEWEEQNPKEAQRVRKNIAERKAKAAAAEEAVEKYVPTSDPIPMAKPGPTMSASMSAAWGSW